MTGACTPLPRDCGQLANNAAEQPKQGEKEIKRDLRVVGGNCRSVKSLNRCGYPPPLYLKYSTVGAERENVKLNHTEGNFFFFFAQGLSNLFRISRPSVK